MKRIVLTAVGGDVADSVSLEAGAGAPPGTGEVAVEIEAAPVNGADVLFALGWFGVYPDVPAEMGAEGVGRVVEVGEHVDSALVGQRVAILPSFRFGTWATRTVVPARNVVPVPEDADALQLAMLSVNPATAYALLHDYVELKPGDWVGLNLANSAVGHYVIALARRAGFKTLAVVRREEAAEQVRRLGADLVVLDGADLGQRVGQALGEAKLRVLFEGTGDPEQTAQLVSAVEDGGTVVAFSSVTGQSPVVPLADLIYRGVSLRSFFILSWLRNTPREQLERVYGELSQLIAEGVISTAVQATYPLEDYRKALHDAQTTGRAGKVLFVPTTSALSR